MISRLKAAIDEAVAAKNIDLILLVLKDVRLYVVCTKEDGQTVPWFVPSLENPNSAVLTVSENPDWLEHALSNNPARARMAFMPMNGADIALMGLNDPVELFIQFEGNAVYKIPRSYFEDWSARR